ncbi:MAG: O-antigen ligase family protein [Melioribacteraceae bacterium]|nr:O-antigen ligase family protein [Melioribacteraceae bacterium]MCF8353481.1 O-antigen ligase family protein [Melioribacteraceae bacterium]MCF8392610.1 O-antigen ligase family protein [Melioribacteraceae bacterium]MCF8418518.1 O-antigen ligase family protein [Melioribacteraceae bacterium]
MNVIQSRYPFKIVFFIFAAAVSSFVLSLFLLQLFFAVLFLLWLFEKNSEKIKAFDRVTILFLLFVAARILSVVFSEYPSASIHNLYKEALFYLSFFAIDFYLKSFSRKDLNKLLTIAIYASAAVALIGIIRFNLQVVERAESFSSGYSTYSAYLITFLPILLARKKWEFGLNKYVWYISCSLIAIGIILALGRANILIAVFALMILFIFRISGWKDLGLVIVIAGVVSFMSFQNNDVLIQQRVEAPTQLSDRDIILKGFTEIYDSHPLLGFGPRTFDNVFMLRDQLADKGVGGWHNVFIQVYVESGLFGLAAFLGLLLFILWKGFNEIRINYQQIHNDGTLVGIYIGLLSLILSGMLGGFITSPVLSIIFVFIILLINRLTLTID